jgi:lysophospholipid acyltransferase (LPLAT)-like uncharacterized protein
MEATRLEKLKFYVLAWIVYILVKILHLTYRFEQADAHNFDATRKLAAPKGWIMACWHHNIFALTLASVGLPYRPLASRSKDGEFISFVLKRLGFVPVRGSSSRGGQSARQQMVSELLAGFPTAVSVDGPRGPKGQVKAGILDLARRSGAPIIPMTAVADRYWEMHKSWDRFRLPKPFAKILVLYGEPITVTADLDGEAFDRELVRIAGILDELDRDVARRHATALPSIASLQG